MRKSVYEWAKEYCGDPYSHDSRGQLIRDFLIEEGMKPHHRVLDIGCGALSQGKYLIEYLESGKYVGLDPNGWLIEAALNEFPRLMDKNPKFSYSPEFSAPGEFDFVISHSVLSHVAYWQLDLALANIRKHVSANAVWLTSLRLDQYDSGEMEWVYPGVSYFRRETVLSKCNHFGWVVHFRPELKSRLSEVCKNDFHDWISLHPNHTASEFNDMRITEEERVKEMREIFEIAKNEFNRRRGLDRDGS